VLVGAQCLDDAIAGAVTEYGRERNQSGIDGESARGSERLGYLANELRNLRHGELAVSVEFRFNDAGEVTGIYAASRRVWMGQPTA
jgi:hypothetical protein